MPDSGWSSVPVSYTHLDVYKRQDEIQRSPALILALEGKGHVDQPCLLYTSTHVKMLRGHLGKCRSYIATVWGIGYKFDPDATR